MEVTSRIFTTNWEKWNEPERAKIGGAIGAAVGAGIGNYFGGWPVETVVGTLVGAYLLLVILAVADEY